MRRTLAVSEALTVDELVMEQNFPLIFVVGRQLPRKSNLTTLILNTVQFLLVKTQHLAYFVASE